MATTLAPVVASSPTTGVALGALVAGDVAGNLVTGISNTVILIVTNTVATAGTINLVTPGVVAPGSHAIADDTLTVPASATNLIFGPFPLGLYGPDLSFTVSAATITVAVVKVIPA